MKGWSMPIRRTTKAATTIRNTSHLPRDTYRVLTNPPVKVNRVQALSAIPGMKTAAALLLALAFAGAVRAAEEPQLIEVVDFSKLLPILPNPPAASSADKAEGSTDDIGGR